MKYIILFLFLPFLVFSQNKGASPIGAKTDPIASGATYAVVVGISDYQDPGIPDLRFADKDAEAFANYLRSEAGGRLDGDHLKVLNNSEATMAQFANALDWLWEVCKEGDQAIIYFSGHGDVEKKTVTNPGFLLCWDAPANVYMGGGAFGLAYLQEIVSTLSSQLKAKVLVITDACHSGKLAGSEIGGTQATASNLAKQFANEVKLMSCQANELSLEGPQWGGGRGVFSFYLLKGLMGLADLDRDGTVSLFEIERYLGDKIPAEVAPKSQIPTVFGAKNTVVSVVDKSSLAVLMQKENVNIPATGMVASRSDAGAPTTGTSIFEKYAHFKEAIKQKHLLYPDKGSAWQHFQELKDHPLMQTEIQSMKGELAAALQDEAQQSINNYLISDYREIKARDKFDSNYLKFPEYLHRAAELLSPSHYLYKTIKARETYFLGLNLRFRGEQSRDTSLFVLAIEKQLAALEWEPNAPYAFCELGYLHRELKHFIKAIEYCNLAIAQSPKWIMPRITLMKTYRLMGGQMERYEEVAQEIVRIDSNSYLARYNLGVAYSNSKKWSKAEEEYKVALAISPNDRETLFNISFVYYQQSKWAEAEKAVATLMQLDPNDLELCIPMACLLIKKGKEEEAFKTIETSVVKGFRGFEDIESEADLSELVKTEKYLSLKKKYASSE